MDKKISSDVAEEAGEIAVKYVMPMSHNRYKVNEIKAMIKTAVMRLA